MALIFPARPYHWPESHPSAHLGSSLAKKSQKALSTRFLLFCHFLYLKIKEIEKEYCRKSGMSFSGVAVWLSSSIDFL